MADITKLTSDSLKEPDREGAQLSKLNELVTAMNGVKSAAEVTGARDDGTALASLLTVLAGLGIITDSTTAT